MEKELVDFLNQNEDLINASKWEALYDKCEERKRSQLTDCLLAADLQIFQEMDKIPEYAFWNSTIAEFTIPKNITTIGDSAFYECSSLSSVVIGDGVTSIGGAAFSNCSSLISVVIPDSVTSIGDAAFYYCKNLEIKYSGTRAQWKELAKGKFNGATYTCTCKDGVLKKSR